MDEDNSGVPLMDGEEESLTSLRGGDMMGVRDEAEYAEIDHINQNDIFEQDNCK